MPIPAERFKLHKDDTNVGVQDLGATNLSEALNSANNTIVEATDSLKSLLSTDVASAVSDIKGQINQAKGTINGIKADVKSKLDAVKSVRDQIKGAINTAKGVVKDVQNTVKTYKDAVNGLVASGKAAIAEVKGELKSLEESITKDPLVREIKGVYGDLRDLSHMNSQELENVLIGSIYSRDPKVKAAMNRLAPQCKTTAAAVKGVGKPYTPKANCNGKESKAGNACDAKVVSDVVSAVTGKEPTNAVSTNNPNEAVSTLVALSKISYDFGMCGVFGDLGSKFLQEKVATHGLLGRVAAAVIAGEVNKGKLTPVFDQAKTQATVGYSIPSNLPNVNGMVLDNFKTKGQYKESELPKLSAQVQGSLDELTLNPNGSTDPLLSVYNAQQFTEDYLKMSDAASLKTLESLSAPSHPSDFLLALTAPQASNIPEFDLGVEMYNGSGKDMSLSGYAAYPY